MRLRDKVALVTGGAQGIGRGIAMRFHQEGAKVLIADIQEKGALTAREIGGDSGDVAFLRADVGEEAEEKAMVAACLERFGALHVIVNDAAWSRGGPTPEVEAAHWQRTLAVILSATFCSAKHGAPEIIRSGGGSIISIASVHGIRAGAGWAAYDAAKGGLIQLVRSLACEFGPQGVRVNAISPGWVVSERTDPRFVTERRWFYPHLYPLRRYGSPADIANAALFLASEEASWITGHNLVVDGGLSVWNGEDMAENLVRELKGSERRT